MRKVPISGRDVFIRLNTVINLSMTALACIAGACMELSNWRQKERDVRAMLKRLRGAPSALSHFTVDSR